MIRVDLPAVLIAEAPPPGGCGPLGALDGDAGNRLAAAADLTRGRLLAGLDRLNLITTAGHGVTEAWSPTRAREAAAGIVSRGHVSALHEGRVVLLAGQRVLKAFAQVSGFPTTLPPLSRLRWRGAEWVPLPHPSGRCRWWKDEALRRGAGEVVRHEVLRAERARTAWCSFGTDVLRGPGMLSPDEGFTYNPLTGELLWVPAHDAAGLALAIRVTDDAEAPQQASRLRLRAQVLEALARNLSRVLRWGGSSTCTVLAHSVRVAHLAAAVARHLPARPDEATVASCRRLGALHDLHEGLPGVGDHPNPPLRLLRHAVPAVDRTHRLAEELVLDLTGARSLLVGLAPAAVKAADRIAAAVERAAYFSDAPAWLGPDLQRLAERMLRSTLPRTCRRFDDKATPDTLLALVGREYDPAAHLHGWPGWCEEVLVCLAAHDRPWQSVLADMVQGAA